jgi:hypothetical protein
VTAEEGEATGKIAGAVIDQGAADVNAEPVELGDGGGPFQTYGSVATRTLGCFAKEMVILFDDYGHFVIGVVTN